MQPLCHTAHAAWAGTGTHSCILGCRFAGQPVSSAPTAGDVQTCGGIRDRDAGREGPLPQP